MMHSWDLCLHELRCMQCGNPGTENNSCGPILIPAHARTHLVTVAHHTHAYLQVVGGDDWPPPWTPHILLQLPQDLKALPAAASILIQLLKQHLLRLGETQLPVIAGLGHQAKPKRLKTKQDREDEKHEAGYRGEQLR